jgi:hypothetical protein
MKTEKIKKLSYLLLIVLGYSNSMEKENFPIKLNEDENLTKENRELINKAKTILDYYNNNLLNKQSTSMENIPGINYKDMEEIIKSYIKIIKSYIKLHEDENLTKKNQDLIKKLKAILDYYNNNFLNKQSTSMENIPEINYKDMKEIINIYENKNININQETKSFIEILTIKNLQISNMNINNKNENFQHIRLNNYEKLKKIEKKKLKNTNEINVEGLKAKDLYKKNVHKNDESVHVEINKCSCEIM